MRKWKKAEFPKKKKKNKQQVAEIRGSEMIEDRIMAPLAAGRASVGAPPAARGGLTAPLERLLTLRKPDGELEWQ